MASDSSNVIPGKVYPFDHAHRGIFITNHHGDVRRANQQVSRSSVRSCGFPLRFQILSVFFYVGRDLRRAPTEAEVGMNKDNEWGRASFPPGANVLALKVVRALG